MNYSKEELTEYNGQKGFWRTINGRKIFISIEDTKEETKEKIKNFVERKKTNVRNKVDEIDHEDLQSRIEKMQEEADKEIAEKGIEARIKYKKLQDKLKELKANNASKEEIEKIEQHIDNLDLFHDITGKYKSNKDITKEEKKELVPRKKRLKEKTDVPKEDAYTRQTMTDPYIAWGADTDVELLKKQYFNSKEEKHDYYSNFEKEKYNDLLDERGLAEKNGRLYNTRTEKFVGNRKARSVRKKLKDTAGSIAKSEGNTASNLRKQIESGDYYKRIFESARQHFEEKGKKYSDDYLLKNSDYLAEKYAKEQMEKLKRWIRK